jgi:predicted small secreted protein
MKKIIALAFLFMAVAAMVSSCAPTRGRGCPSTNKNYFKP